MERGPCDEALMRRLAGSGPSACDETAAFDTLYERHRRAVMAYLFRHIGDLATAEDLTQECFLRVWRARHHYQPTAAFRTWLFTIARRLALDVLKRRAPVVSIEPDSEGDSSPSLSDALTARLAESDPEAILFGRELERRLEEALGQLPEELREAVALRDMAEMSYEETARVIGCPLGTVKSRLNAARRRLRIVALEWLEAREDDPTGKR
jgi:RNA polymerase sigma-70 factor, ECF subfamily